jgi:hypothetical protein
MAEKQAFVPATGLVKRTETILLAEDQEGVRKFARTALQTFGYTVLEARDGDDAILVCKEHRGPIHLILTDIVMPGINGYELVTHLSTLHPGIKILYMSGYPDEIITRHGNREPKAGFLRKPFEPDDLLHKVRDVLNAPAA